jgi:hypothetical protein
MFEKAIACADQITKKFRETGELVQTIVNEKQGLRDLVFSSAKYRRAHISIVDARESKKLWLLHVTVFPHYNDPSPIYGFDVICGPTKVSGAFHDFSHAGDPTSFMWLWFNAEVNGLEWNKKRELPDWARQIFSPAMVAIGAVGADELDEFVKIGLTTLDFYLDKVGCDQQIDADYHMAQNRYCHYQKQNPHTPNTLVNLGFTKGNGKSFI